MAPPQRIYGRITAVTGVAALLLAAFWYWRSWNDGLTFPPVPANDVADIAAFYAFWLLAVTFEFGVPLLCLITGLFGLPARRETASRIGLGGALVALMLYGAYIKSCSNAVSG